MNPRPFSPAKIYRHPPELGPLPRVLQAPPRYIQGPNILQHVGRYVSVIGISRFAVLASARGLNAQAATVIDSLTKHQHHAIPSEFAGECSIQEIEKQVVELANNDIQCLIAIGGGKCVDAGKCIAQRLNVPVIIIPTLASNDAPCSAVSVIYSPDGAQVGAEMFPANPMMVIVDTAVVAEADERFLVAGIGDAMATWYEARVCEKNPAARTVIGARPTMTACAMGELCAHTLFAHGIDAAKSVAQNQVSEPLERVVEANTLLSGIGFESGGLAAAHGIAIGYTNVAQVEATYLHGEMVAMGLLVQLVIEKNEIEAAKVAKFFSSVGLPIHLEQLGLRADMSPQLNAIVDGAMVFPHLKNLPFEVNASMLHDGILRADQLGREIAIGANDAAYTRLHSAGS